MDKALKQRMIGAVVLIALGVIFIPMLLDGGESSTMETVSVEIPEPMQPDFQSRLLPLDDSVAAELNSDDEFGLIAREDNAIESETNSEPDPGEPSAPIENAVTTAPPTGSVPAANAPITEPEAQAPPEDSSESGSSGLANWFVQVGSFSDESNALDLRDRLREADISAYVEAVNVSGTETHRVIAGPEMSEAKAEVLRDGIQERFGLNGLVFSE